MGKKSKIIGLSLIAIMVVSLFAAAMPSITAQAQPDLVITSFSTVDGKIHYTIANQGNANAPRSYTGVYAGGRYVARGIAQPLAQGESRNEQINYRGGDTVCADYQNRIPESNENNNCYPPGPEPTPTPIGRYPTPGVEVPINPNGIPDSWYEEIAAIGFYPQERRLCAVILIKRPTYYSGENEYVHFWADWNNDTDFNDPGEDLGASYVPVTDPGLGVPLPLEYCVYKDIVPKVPVNSVVRVKAVLSWSTDPNFWGDIEYTWIRIDPIRC